MSFLEKDFTYMPDGSYAICPDGSVLFRMELPEELKQRFLADLEKKREYDRTHFAPEAFV